MPLCFHSFEEGKAYLHIYYGTHLKGDVADFDIIERPFSEKLDLGGSGGNKLVLVVFFDFFVGDNIFNWFFYVGHGEYFLSQQMLQSIIVGVLLALQVREWEADTEWKMRIQPNCTSLFVRRFPTQKLLLSGLLNKIGDNDSFPFVTQNADVEKEFLGKSKRGNKTNINFPR